MKFFLKSLIILITAVFCNPGLYAQRITLPAGGEANGEGGTVSWSVGQVAYSVWEGTEDKLTEGVQQPYEIFIMPGFQEFQSESFCIIFPNPTSENVNLKITDPKLKNLSFCIFDTEGRQLRKMDIGTTETTIPMDDLKPGTYFLVIQEMDQTKRTYKIIKK